MNNGTPPLAADPGIAELMDRLLRDGIKPHGRRIAELGLSGRIACLVFEPGPTAVVVLKAMKRERSGPLFPLSSFEIGQLARSDRTTARWLATPSSGIKQKIFVFVHEGTLLLNHERGRGYSLEPGSTDWEEQVT
jgi:hypothetical protein